MSDEPDDSSTEEMNVQERVFGHLLRDPALADVVSRGLVNMGRTARWLRRTNDWDARTADIVRSLKDPMVEDRPPVGHRHLLEETSVGLTTGLALLTTSRYLEIRERIEDAWACVVKGPRTSIIDYDGRLKLIVSDGAVEEVREVLPKDSILEVHRPLSSINLYLPDGAGGVVSAGIIVSVFLHREIPVLHVAAGGSQAWILVPGQHLMEAYDIALVVTGRRDAWPSALRGLLESRNP